jgi:TatD DNase family protein
MWFDSHFHLNMLASVWQPQKTSGGLAVAVSAKDWQLTRDRLQMLSGDWRQAIGFHPWIAQDNLPWLDFESWLSADANLSVGEIGLDGSPNHRDNAAAQWIAFARQVGLAREGERVMSLHLVQDEERGYQLIRQCKNCCGIVHGFTGSLQQALAWQGLGFYIGIGGRFLSQLTDKRISLLQGIDKSLILLESDAPYGVSTVLITPDVISSLAEVIALSWDVSVDDVALICQDNWNALWGSTNEQ